jgi:phage regulator Rha-like protein
MSNLVQTSVEVQERDGVLVVDSRLIAERLGIEHESFLKTIDTHKASIEEAFGSFRFEIGAKEFLRKDGQKGASQFKYALLTEEQATALMTLSRNTPQVVELKINLVRAFSEARKAKSISAVQQSPLQILHVAVNYCMTEVIQLLGSPSPLLVADSPSVISGNSCPTLFDNFFKPKALMLHAANISRSCSRPHSQRHVLSDSVSASFRLPQGHCLLLGSKRPICTKFLPDHAHLYSTIVRNFDQLTSPIAWARLWFFIIPAMFRFSTQTVWFSRTMRVLTLCRKSLRWLVTFSYRLASRLRAFSRFLLLLAFLECLYCKYLSRLSDFFRCFGLAIFSPVESVAKSFKPTSMPMVVDSCTGASVGAVSGVSTRTLAKYLFVGVLLMVTVLIFPSNARCSTALTAPIFGNSSVFDSHETETPCGNWQDWRSCLDLKRGKPFFALKNRLYAESKFLSEDCKVWLYTSLNHDVSSDFLSVGSSVMSALQESDSPRCSNASLRLFKPQLYTQRTQPKCCASAICCGAVGYKRYLKARSIEQMYDLFSQQFTDFSTTTKRTSSRYSEARPVLRSTDRTILMAATKCLISNG